MVVSMHVVITCVGVMGMCVIYDYVVIVYDVMDVVVVIYVVACDVIVVAVMFVVDDIVVVCVCVVDDVVRVVYDAIVIVAM